MAMRSRPTPSQSQAVEFVPLVHEVVVWDAAAWRDPDVGVGDDEASKDRP